MPPALRLTTYRCGHDAPPASETLRVGTVRFLPRGVPKSRYAADGYFDVWLPGVAPSRELIRRFLHEGDLTPKAFFAAYRREMKAAEPRQTIALLARVAERTPVAIGCYCEDESACHRSVLAELLRAVARGGR